uniref:Transthyretin-like protein n=1 Tax=Plectus sambesii TaxID=2011161 RepID=A0A914V6K0_9BILA
RAKGKLECSTDPRKAGGVRVLLMDRDGLPWESDDLMGRTVSDASGRFEVEGCGYDVGPWNEPDPYILIEHDCPSVSDDIDDTDDSPKTTKALMWRTYLPDETNVGTIELDQNQ